MKTITASKPTPLLLNVPTAKTNESCGLRAFCSVLSDEDIVGHVKKNKECFACLVERYEKKMQIYVKRITGAPDETVEDIVQEVFIKVYANIHVFDQSKKFSSWIYRIAHNQAVNTFLYERRRRTENIMDEEGAELNATLRDSHDIWREIQQKSLNEDLKNALSNVSQKYQDVIELNYFHEKSYQQIARELGKPVNTIGTTLNRGKKLLKKELLKMGVFCDVAMVQTEKAFSYKN